ncbi:MotA/TolQ/ExbB proton channel family protein [Parathalassolituus penaei]|uniref:MotA/TolQ/ExbB proton channel family protein n=1 Tax=Parathalassolituus penaei TaxID=2997323 RepID=A0A9X3EBL7_9GAMM|nr:MotA/TolQ/ExbB proton channel family protein [Parathalassolituus penaei]MCY0964215.1 MotA/TolQ/ExbB proton channel family protein [Parathalassolituus penaei]
MDHPVPFRIFLQWLLLSTVSFAVLVLLWDLHVLQYLLISDSTRITGLTVLVYLFAAVHGGYRSWFLAREHEALQAALDGRPASRLVGRYLLNLDEGVAENSVAAEIFAERARGQHQVGWFVTGVVIKLGLLGTVIGFVLMLGSVSQLDNLDISDIKMLMQQMTSGMGVAMNTTLVALVCSILMGLQYLLLDRSADLLVAGGVELGQQRLRVLG